MGQEEEICSFHKLSPAGASVVPDDRSSGRRNRFLDLIAAVILQESGGDPLSYSVSGAVGLMQIMPRDGLAEAFMCINGPCFSSRPTIEELQVRISTSFGARMLAGCMQTWFPAKLCSGMVPWISVTIMPILY